MNNILSSTIDEGKTTADRIVDAPADRQIPADCTSASPADDKTLAGRISDAFAGGKTFIPFITCGDPDLATTAACVRAAAAVGADLIELGIPFSDPTAALTR